MSIQDSIVGLIEVEVPEGRNLASVVDALVRAPDSQPRAIMCVVRGGAAKSVNESPSDSSCEVLADLSQLNDSLSDEFAVVMHRLNGST